MIIHIVFKYQLDHHKDVVVDSVWRNFHTAYDRMMSLKKGGFIESHTLLQQGDNTIDQSFNNS